MDLTPGKNLSFEITRMPSSGPAQRTLLRLCRKDPAIARSQRVLKRKRPSWQTWRRGGRLWHHQMRSKPGIKFDVGTTYSLLATVDVIRDLESVSRWVKVKAKS